MDNIDFKIYKEKDYNTENWMGGTTKELSIYPKESKYCDREFIWRLSSATVDIEESHFTKLPGYDRVLIVLENEVILVHREERVVRLAQYEQDRFDGAYDTTSFGKITDFNLMVKKGNHGFAEVIALSSTNIVVKPENFIQYNSASDAYYCTEGFCVVSFASETCILKKGELLVVNYPMGKIESFGVMGEGKVIRSHVYFNEEKLSPELILKKKATYNDFLIAARICHTNFRGSKYMFKELKNLWYDEALQKGIDNLEKTFLTFIIVILGIAVLTFGAIELNIKEDIVAVIIFLWLLVDFMLINPLLYFIFLPKPIAAHIKNIDSLTAYEKTVYERQKKENKQAEKVLKKYEITGRNIYKD